MRRIAAAAVTLGLALTATASAQQVQLEVHGARLTRQDGDARWAGTGVGGDAMVQHGRFRLTGSVSTATLKPASAPNVAVANVKMTAFDVRAGYRALPVLWVELGAVSERISPTLSAQDVGGIWGGVRLEGNIGTGMTAWVSAAVAPVTHSNGGTPAGASSLPTGVGFGATVAFGPRVRASASYALHRLDRFAVQSSAATLGVGIGLF